MMKKITVFLVVFLMIFPCISVAAAEEEVPEYLNNYDCVLGEVGDYTLVYKSPDKLTENNNYVTWGIGYFGIKCDNIPLYIVNDVGGPRLSGQAYRRRIDENGSRVDRACG